MTSSTGRIGWIGVGRMGYPLVERLIADGADVTLYNRTRAKAEALAAAGARLVDAPAEAIGRAAADGGVVLLELRPADGSGLEELFLRLTTPEPVLETA